MVGFVAGPVILIWFLFTRPQVGMVAGAAMQNPTIVAAFGVEPRLVYMATFAYGSALAGLAGAVMAPLTGMVPSLGLAFIARIFIT